MSLQVRHCNAIPRMSLQIRHCTVHHCKYALICLYARVYACNQCCVALPIKYVPKALHMFFCVKYLQQTYHMNAACMHAPNVGAHTTSITTCVNRQQPACCLIACGPSTTNKHISISSSALVNPLLVPARPLYTTLHVTLPLHLYLVSACLASPTPPPCPALFPHTASCKPDAAAAGEQQH